MKITKKERKLAIQEAKVNRIEDALLHDIESGAMPPLYFPVKHHFSEGIYCREIFIAAGHYVGGVKHKISSYFIVAYGTLEIIGAHKNKIVTAPYLSRNEPGQKNGVFAHTDVLIYQFTPNPTNSTDLFTVYSEVVENPNEVQGMPGNKQDLAYKRYLLCHSEQ